MLLGWIFIATFCIALLSLIGMGFLFAKTCHAEKWLLGFVALSAGAMLGNAAFHLLPETFELAGEQGVPIVLAMGLFVLAFFLSLVFEQVFTWHHCHTTPHKDELHPHQCPRTEKPYTHLVLISDSIHNFIDGIIIATSFLVSPALGVTTTLAIALHEIPQELGDFAVLVHGGMRKMKALALNLLSASTVIVGGLVGYFVANQIELAVPILLPFAAGSFVYIAAADLLPELKHDQQIRRAPIHLLIFAIGLGVMLVTALVE